MRFSIRQLAALQTMYGRGRWREKKGVATVRLPNGTVREADVHRYEAHGVGRRQIRVKRLID